MLYAVEIRKFPLPVALQWNFIRPSSTLKSLSFIVSFPLMFLEKRLMESIHCDTAVKFKQHWALDTHILAEEASTRHIWSGVNAGNPQIKSTRRGIYFKVDCFTQGTGSRLHALTKHENLFFSSSFYFGITWKITPSSISQATATWGKISDCWICPQNSNLSMSLKTPWFSLWPIFILFPLSS